MCNILHWVPTPKIKDYSEGIFLHSAPIMHTVHVLPGPFWVHNHIVPYWQDFNWQPAIV